MQRPYSGLFYRPFHQRRTVSRGSDGGIIPSAIRTKRAYEPLSATDGTRALTDRLGRRGLRKSEAAIDEWVKELSPSIELRNCFGHDPVRWEEFRRRFARELHAHVDRIEQLRDVARHGTFTLVYSAHDEQQNMQCIARIAADTLAVRSDAPRDASAWLTTATRTRGH